MVNQLVLLAAPPQEKQQHTTYSLMLGKNSMATLHGATESARQVQSPSKMTDSAFSRPGIAEQKFSPGLISIHSRWFYC